MGYTFTQNIQFFRLDISVTILIPKTEKRGKIRSKFNGTF